jgi:hypothetical protein
VTAKGEAPSDTLGALQAELDASQAAHDATKAELATARASLVRATVELEQLKAKATQGRGGLLQGEGRMKESTTLPGGEGVTYHTLPRDIVTTHGPRRAKELQTSLGTYARAYAIDAVSFEELVAKKLVEVA